MGKKIWPKKIPHFTNYDNLPDGKNYTYYLKETWEQKRNKIQADCEHQHWIKACSKCRFVMDSDMIHEDTLPEEVVLS